jgi:hypothetical protein
VSALSRLLWTAALALHLLFIIAASLQDMAAVAGDASAAPRLCKAFWSTAQSVSAGILGKHLADGNPVRQALKTYTDCTGIEAGYSYFAPSVPSNCKLTFELHYPNGRIEFDVPVVAETTAGYRISTLLDHLRGIAYVRLREAILSNLVYSIRREHPDAAMIRAVFGVASLPSIGEFRAGKRVSYRVLYAYDFRFHSKASPSKTP